VHHSKRRSTRLSIKKLTPEQQDELSEKILDATSFEEIHAWLKSIRGN
jgi:Domain of unknown function (DUF4351)